jgi:hypothetical protein
LETMAWLPYKRSMHYDNSILLEMLNKCTRIRTKEFVQFSLIMMEHSVLQAPQGILSFLKGSDTDVI